MSTGVDTWTCAHCGALNKPSWRFCTSCEAMPDGRRRADHLPPPPRDPEKAVLPGLVLLAVLLAVGVAVALVGPDVWDSAAAFLGG